MIPQSNKFFENLKQRLPIFLAGYGTTAQMKRGDLIRVALQGDFGKPRPALVIQSNAFMDHTSVTVLPLTSDLRQVPALRINVVPDQSNGLRLQSDIMIDKAVTVASEKAGLFIGTLSDADMSSVNRALALFLGFN